MQVRRVTTTIVVYGTPPHAASTFIRRYCHAGRQTSYYLWKPAA